MKRTTSTGTKGKQPDAKLRTQVDRESICIAEEALREAVIDLTVATHEARGGCEIPWKELEQIRDRVTQALVCVEMVMQRKADKVVPIGRAKGGAA